MISGGGPPVQLDKPGAGLPFLEWLVAKYVLVPRLLRNLDQAKSCEKFAASSTLILEACKQAEANEIETRVLIPRLRGLEDSSRFWSVSMTLEHLVITNSRLAPLLRDLAAGKTNLPAISTADIKPTGSYHADEAIQAFKFSVDKVIQATSENDLNSHPQAKFPHPWFGPLNALEWLTFASAHNQIHHRQVQQIMARLIEKS